MKFFAAICAGMVQLGAVLGEPEANAQIWPNGVVGQPFYTSPRIVHPLVYNVPGVPASLGPILSAFKPESYQQSEEKTAIASGVIPPKGKADEDAEHGIDTYWDNNLNELERLISKNAGRKLYHDKHLTKLALLHCQDQQAHDDAGGDFPDHCNLHSWFKKPPPGHYTCCYPDDHSNDGCMKKVEDNWRRHQGLKTYGNVYEVSANSWPSMNARQALKQWKTSTGHWEPITATGPTWGQSWAKNVNHFGCAIYGNFANCYFQNPQ